MTLEEAIPILEEMYRYAQDRDLVDDSEALQLGIGALIRLRGTRADHADLDFPLLPGETKE